jgi:hypothetical protein
MTRLAVAAAFLAALTLGACAKVGALEQPAPMFGQKAKADYAARKAAVANAKTAAQEENNGPPEALAPSASFDPTTTPGSLPPAEPLVGPK